ncbi:MAG: AAA family ATPase, partial [Promethearchaeota archaeon]
MVNNKKEVGEIIATETNNISLKKVILENFLSFQRDEVDLDNAKFIIIIGPNWSGKTSIFQAIRFALGSNERDERYKKWSDFIRNGQDHAMVELHIQNNNEVIKIRRVVIKGQSPFFEIEKGSNGFKRMHAVEIQKLISNLKINPDNQFAFVSQGKIDAIKNLKPIELCIFLEEGIGLKGLRDEILQQKGNINHLNRDFQSLVSRRNTLNISLNLLQPKLKRLKQKHNLLDLKKVYEDELLYANKNELEEKILVLKEKIKNLQIVIAEIKKDSDNNEKLLLEKDSKINRIEVKINDFSKELGKLIYKKKNLIEKIKTWEKEKIQAKKELDILNQEIITLEKRLRNVESQSKTLDTEISTIKMEKKTLKLKIDDLIKEQNTIAKRIKQNEDFLKDYNQLIHRKQKCLTKIEGNKNKIKDLNSEINEIFQSFKDIEHKLEKDKWFLENPTTNLLMHIDNELRKIS